MSTMPMADRRGSPPPRSAKRYRARMRPAIAVLAAGAALIAAGVTGAASARTTGKIFTINAVVGELFIGQVATASCPHGASASAPDLSITWTGGSEPVPASTELAGSQILISGRTTYYGVGQVPGTVTGTYTCGKARESLSAQFQADVADAPITATGVPMASHPGRPVSGAVATFTDADPKVATTEFTATIDWGDGKTSHGHVVTGAGGHFLVTGIHLYPNVAAVFPIEVSIDHSGGSKASVFSTASISRTKPVARFTFPSSGPAAGQPLTFDAIASQSPGSLADSYTWTLSGAPVTGGTYTAACQFGTSQMVTSFHAAGQVRAALKVTYASGQTSTTTRSFTVAAAKVAKIDARVAKSATQWVLCQRGPRDPPVLATENGGPPLGCQDVFNDGIIQAIGCFTVLKDFGAIPASEYSLMCPFFVTSCKETHSGVPGLGQARRPLTSRASPEAIPQPGPQPCLPCALTVSTILPVMATSTVRVNGLDITPKGGSALVIDANDGLMADSLDDITLLGGSLKLATSARLITSLFNVNGDLPLLDANLTNLEAASPSLRNSFDLSGFMVSGTMSVSLVRQASTLTASVTLPSSFANSNGSRLSNPIAFSANNQRGMQLTNILIQIPSLTFNGIEFDNVTFCYQDHVSDNYCQANTLVNFGTYNNSSSPSWNAGGEIKIFNNDIQASPTVANPQQGIAFVAGTFDFAGLTDTFNPPLTIVPGLKLNSITAQLVLAPPAHFAGSLSLTAVNLATVSGGIFLVNASPANTYTFTGNELPGVTGYPHVTVHSFAGAVGGAVTLTVPIGIGNVSLGANAYVIYAWPSYFAVGGTANFSVLGATINGSVNGQANIMLGLFNVQGNVSVTNLFGFNVGAQFVVSSNGGGLCASIGLGLFTLYIGFAAPPLHGIFSFSGCDLSPYIVVVPAVIPFANGGKRPSYRLDLPAGLSSESITLTGNGGAPDVTITGPHGVHFSTGTKGLTHRGQLAADVVPSQHTTYLAIDKPPAGTYTITANAGSPPIAKVTNAHAINPSVTGKVVRDGDALLLHYDVRGNDGQPVTFVQQSPLGTQPIGTTSAATGTLRFTPAPGPAGTRHVIAELTQNGAPVVLTHNGKVEGGLGITVASFHAPGLQRLPAVSGLSVRHVGSHLLVRFGPVRDGSHYAVLVTLASGGRRTFLVTGGSATIDGVFGEITGHVAVQAVGDNYKTLTGPATTTKFGASHGD